MQISSRRNEHHPGDTHDRLHDYFYVLKMHLLTSLIFTFSSALASDMTNISAEDTLEENEKLQFVENCSNNSFYSKYKYLLRSI